MKKVFRVLDIGFIVLGLLGPWAEGKESRSKPSRPVRLEFTVKGINAQGEVIPIQGARVDVYRDKGDVLERMMQGPTTGQGEFWCVTDAKGWCALGWPNASPFRDEGA